jgi:hypothetical protein
VQDVLWHRRGRGGGLSFQIPQIRILASARMEAGGLKALGAEPVELAAERGWRDGTEGGSASVAFKASARE